MAHYETEILRLMGRMANALEKLTTDPEIEIEAGPPICPHCGQFDPTVRVAEGGGGGPLSEFVLIAACDNCKKMMYVLTESYSVHRVPETAKAEIDERRKVGFFQHVQNQRTSEGAETSADAVGATGM